MTTALLTDRYELTMLGAALRDGTAQRHCAFEVFARRLPDGRRYGVVAGTGRVLDAIADFRFDEPTVAFLRSQQIVDDVTADFLATYRFTGDIDGYHEGELYFPHSPILTVTGTFAEAVVLETLVLSILNHDSAIASAAARMVTAASGASTVMSAGPPSRSVPPGSLNTRAGFADSSSIARVTGIRPACTSRSNTSGTQVSSPTMPKGARSNSTSFSSA